MGCCISLIKATFLSYCFVGKKRKMAWNAVPLCLFGPSEKREGEEGVLVKILKGWVAMGHEKQLASETKALGEERLSFARVPSQLFGSLIEATSEMGLGKFDLVSEGWLEQLTR
ncbi:hypothetical protein CK203_095506 [Vitis vinifera]|uniref:Uncharacterized protein n=1 Tax=Vitis vinifera TaxID=29760 RepID=A0A438CJA7_VITVI|nr:hypothetical protein CK203_095506 [Vitis vinifera]